MSGFWDWFKREIVDGGVGARHPTAYEATEARASLDPELREALEKVEAAKEFFEKVQQRTLYYYRYHSENVRPFDILTKYLAEAESSSREALHIIARNKNIRALRPHLNQPPVLNRELKFLQVRLKEHLVYAVYSLEQFHNQLQSLEGYDDHKESLRRFLDSLEPFVAIDPDKGGGKLGNRNSYLLAQRLRKEYERKQEERERNRERERQEYQRKTRHQDSKAQRPDASRSGDNNEQLEALVQTNREILKELQEAEEARARAERREELRELRRELLKRHPKWWLP